MELALANGLVVGMFVCTIENRPFCGALLVSVYYNVC